MAGRRIILHIGMYKTGTTSLQIYLKSLHDALLEKAVLYPLTGIPARKAISFGHHDLANAAAAENNGKSVEIFEALQREIEMSAAKTVVISSENFCSLADLGVLQRYFAGVPMHICVWLRRQDELLNALYYTSLMDEKHSLTPREFSRGSIQSILDYHVLLQRWRSAFPDARLSVRLYEKARTRAIDTIVDFLNVTDLACEVGLPQERMTAHRTLPARVTIALKSLIETGISPKDFYSIFCSAQEIYGDSREEISVYAPSERRALLEQYRHSNRRVSSDFLDRPDEDLFTDIPLDSDKEWSQKVGSEDTAIARLLIDMSRFINSRV